MTKKYNSPMLQVVSIRKKDIIATSDLSIGLSSGSQNNDAALGVGRRWDDWNEGF